MHLFTDYIQPLTYWLFDHPHWALFITFLISLSESLAIVGSIIPGSVTMTAIGILAGSGVMRIDLTLIAATLGAIAGDSVSYALGYTFSDRLVNLWPFKNYPRWLNYGKEYFAVHGAMSVLIGRFVGPMRSIIPIIAGMMRMNHLHFFVANFISAIAWAILYVMPGVLIGAASSELSAESATRLFILILILLVILWITSLALKWLVMHANQLLRTSLHNFWLRLQEQPRIASYIKLFVPQDEVNHYSTALLVILTVICFIVSSALILFVIKGSGTTVINEPVFLFLQSLRTQSFDTFFIIISLILSPLPLLTLLAAFVLYTIYYRDNRALYYWLSIFLITTLALLLLNNIHTPILTNIPKNNTPPPFPAKSLTYATALLGFLTFYINTYFRTTTSLIIRISALILLLLKGLGTVYLGDNWITGVISSYFIGATICLLHWLFYRRIHLSYPRSQIPILIGCFLFLLAGFTSYWLYFNKLARAHHPYLQQYVITDKAWWNQQRPLLPVYSLNRIGQKTGLFNIQYAGSLISLEHSLESNGWKRQPNSFFYSLLLRAGGKNTAEELPLMTPLYLNRKPALVMTYHQEKNKPLLILRLWRSNYHLQHYRQPLWLGSLSPRTLSKSLMALQKKKFNAQTRNDHNNIIKGLPGFHFNKIPLPHHYLHSISTPVSPILLIIKEPKAASDNKNQHNL